MLSKTRLPPLAKVRHPNTDHADAHPPTLHSPALITPGGPDKGLSELPGANHVAIRATYRNMTLRTDTLFKKNFILVSIGISP